MAITKVYHSIWDCSNTKLLHLKAWRRVTFAPHIVIATSCFTIVLAQCEEDLEAHAVSLLSLPLPLEIVFRLPGASSRDVPTAGTSFTADSPDTKFAESEACDLFS